MIIGIILLVLGILVLVSPAFLQIVVGVALIIGGLYIALQAAQGNPNI